MGIFDIFGKSKKKKKENNWDSLPSSVRSLPYILIAGALSSFFKYYFNLKVDDVILMGLINVIILIVKNIFKYIKK